MQLRDLMNNFRQRFTRKETYARLKVPIVVALVALGALVLTVGFVWFGWRDIVRNRNIIDSLPIPPGAVLTHIGSEPHAKDDSFITPPDRWNTLAIYEAPGLTPEYLTDFYISRLSSRWVYCTRRLVPGARFIRDNYVVSLDASNAAASPPGVGSFDIYVEHDVKRHPCKD